jgi:uridine kinase
VTASIKPDKGPKPFLLGVAGGSGSGKTYFARALRQKLGEGACELVYQDNFYRDQSGNFDGDGGAVNFDHPDSLDFELLADCLSSLCEGKPTEIPVYDFVTHARSQSTLLVQPRPILIVDGILILHPERLRGLFDESIFFDTPEALRYHRRLERDVKERGRTPEGVRAQFLGQVKPMHDAFVEPTKALAGMVVSDQGGFSEALAGVFARLSRRSS